jgi:O-antigen ligase
VKERVLNVCRHGIRFSFYGIAVVLPFSPFFLELFGVLIIVFFITMIILKPDICFLNNLTACSLVFFLFFLLLSAFLNPDLMSKSLVAFAGKWLKFVALFFAAQIFFRDWNQVRIIARIFLVMGILIAIDALSQKFLGIEFLRGRGAVDVTGIRVARASFSHYNHLGTYLLFPLSWILSFLILRRPYSRSDFLKAALVLLLLLTSLALTFSRGAWLGCCFACLALSFLSRKWQLLLGLTVLLAIVIASFPIVQLRFQGQGTLGIDSGRFEIWFGALKMFEQSPIWGKGIGTFMDRIQNYYSGEQGAVYAHNSYLQMLAETGISGFCAFMVFLASFFRKALRHYGNYPTWFLAGALAGTFGFLTHSFFDNQLYSLQMSYLFWLMAGLLASVSSENHVKI